MNLELESYFCFLFQKKSTFNIKVSSRILLFSLQLSCLVQRVLRHNRLCVTIGGDHAIGMGTVQGFTSAFEVSKRNKISESHNFTEIHINR